MIEDKVLESNVTVLRTPLVDIEIVDEEDNSIPFDIVESWNSNHDVYINNVVIPLTHQNKRCYIGN